jgi:hypothetical protein
VEFVNDRRALNIIIYQTKYIEEVLKRFGMEVNKPSATPLDTKVRLLKLSNEEYDGDARCILDLPYKQVVGPLIYGMVDTRVDFAASISSMSQYQGGAIGWV